MQKNNKLIAVSGGVDSMLLLNRYRKDQVIVAYVNYNLRYDVHIDQKIVTEYCLANNLKLEILSIKSKKDGNFQNWARIERYNFFKLIYEKYNCNQLILAHHKDDFLETALMQWKSHRNPYYYGIKKENNVFEMNIYRPMIFQYWKTEIYEIAKNSNLKFNDDYTNFINCYSRNKIRYNLKTQPLVVKEILFNAFLKTNVEKSIKKIEVIKIYFEWSKSSFNINFLIKNQEYAIDLIFKYLITNFHDININLNILKAIYKFLTSEKRDSEFLLSKNQKIFKKKNNLINNSNSIYN